MCNEGESVGRMSGMARSPDHDARAFDVHRNKHGYSLGDTMNITVRGRMLRGELVYPVTLVDIKVRNTVVAEYTYQVCQLQDTTSCPLEEGGDFVMSIVQGIPSYRFLQRFVGEPITVIAGVEEGMFEVGCVAFEFHLVENN